MGDSICFALLAGSGAVAFLATLWVVRQYMRRLRAEILRVQDEKIRLIQELGPLEMRARQALALADAQG
jgi:hypothetical protein